MARRSLPPLTTLPAFEATARLGSVTAAADEFGRTQGAVSKQLRQLADHLGVALFERDGVGLRITANGRMLAQVTGRALSEIEDVCDALRVTGAAHRVDLGLSPTLAIQWLIPRLARLQAQAPDLDVKLTMLNWEETPSGDLDMVLSVERLRWPLDEVRLPVEVVGDVAFGMVHAPDDPVERTADGCRVETRFAPSETSEVWDIWSARSGVRVTFRRIEPQRHADAISATAAGLGVALTERRLVETELAAGRLAPPFGFTPIPDGFVTILSERGGRRASAARLIAWLRAEARATV